MIENISFATSCQLRKVTSILVRNFPNTQKKLWKLTNKYVSFLYVWSTLLGSVGSWMNVPVTAPINVNKDFVIIIIDAERLVLHEDVQVDHSHECDEKVASCGAV